MCQPRADKPLPAHHPLEMDEGGEWLGTRPDWLDHIYLVLDTRVTSLLTHMGHKPCGNMLNTTLEHTLCNCTQDASDIVAHIDHIHNACRISLHAPQLDAFQYVCLLKLYLPALCSLNIVIWTRHMNYAWVTWVLLGAFSCIGTVFATERNSSCKDTVKGVPPP